METLHRRKPSSQDTDADPKPNGVDVSSTVAGLAPPSLPSRSRVQSTPNTPYTDPPAVTHLKPAPPPLGVGIPARRPPTVSLNTPPTSPFRTSFVMPRPRAHSRTRSISSGSPASPSTSSPLVPMFSFPTLGTTPELTVTDTENCLPPGHTRRHSRLHSRNLSVFFPRPHSTIAAFEKPEDEEAPAPPPEPLMIPTAHSEPILGPGVQAGRDLDGAFTFGGIPKSGSEPENIPGSRHGIKPRRGHHHKHSVSHTLFSFLEPGQSPAPSAISKLENLRTTPTPTLVSHWSTIPDPSLPASSSADLISRPHTSSSAASLSDSQSTSSLGAPPSDMVVSRSGKVAAATALVQFLLGAILWVRGQNIGSLACTGLGYWVIFDAFGIAGPAVLAHRVKQYGTGMYGPARCGTTLLFAQCVYLMFSGVYVAKEAVEHLFLAAGNGIHEGDGHHHHWGDEEPEMLAFRYPVALIFMALLSLVGTSAVFGQHDVLVDITNKHIPSPREFFFWRNPHRMVSPTEPTSFLTRIARNPYALPPILFCIAILSAEGILDIADYVLFDVGLAAAQVVVTLHVAFVACVVLGGVLLQTAPPTTSGAQKSCVVPPGPAGKMEAFWRAVREIERHEHVMQLPAPHIWQVVAAGQPRSIEVEAHAIGHVHPDHHPYHRHSGLPPAPQLASPSVIVTLAVHVRKELCDSDVLALTRWASARMHGAFGRTARSGKDGEVAEVEITVGVVRG